MLSRANKSIIFVGALCGASVLAACGTAEEETPVARSEKKALGVGSAERANAELEEAVRAKLDSDERIKRAKLKVEADVTRNQITLSGAVPSEALRAKAIELAKGAHAGVVVADKMK